MTAVKADWADGDEVGAAHMNAVGAGVNGSEQVANKNQPNGYAGLDGGGKVAAAQLPSYVDDALEYATQSAFPATGETGKIYVDISTGDAFRWTGSVYTRISDRITASGITDSGTTGRAVVMSETQADARAVLGAVGTSDPIGPVDLRLHWDQIRNGHWKTSTGAQFTSGGATLRNSPAFTAADIGKIAIVNNTSGSSVFTRAMGTIMDVDGSGVATMDWGGHPPTTTASGRRMIWGFDITATLAGALAELAADTDGTPRDAYLAGIYRMSQLVVPQGVRLAGAGWGAYGIRQLYGAMDTSLSTALWQLPGSQKDFVVFSPYPGGDPTWMGPVGLARMELQGPEVNVDGQLATVGSGLTLKNAADGTPMTTQDGCEFDWLHVSQFPESGMNFASGGVPLTVSNCRTFYNGTYGVDYHPGGPSGTQMVHFLNLSGDGNPSGLVRLQGLSSSYSPVVFTAIKSEADADSNRLVVPLGADYQMKCLIFEDCDQAPIVVNGLSHIYGGGAKGPGPAITIRSTSGKRPRVSFDGVAVRVVGSETGSIADAVTLRDEVAGVDIPRTTASGYYPETNPVSHGRVEVLKGGRIDLFGTSDQATNFEKAVARWNGSNFEIGNLFGGSGTSPGRLHVGIGNAADSDALARWLELSPVPPFGLWRWTAASQTGKFISIGGGTDSLNASSGVQIPLAVDVIANQSGTAGYTAVFVNVVETATGSGVKLLMDLQRGGTSQATIDRAGNAYIAGTLDIGNASDTTLSRISAGVLGVEGVAVISNGGALGTPSSGALANCTGLPVTGVFANGGSALKDNNGNELVVFGATASAVNQVRISNSVTGAPARIAAEGDDTDVSLNLASKGAGGVLANGLSVATGTGSMTLTNKRITLRIGTVASSATPAINTDSVDQFNITALAANITSMTSSLAGTPTDGQRLAIRITGDATPHTIAWGASFISSGSATLLATTAASKTHMCRFTWDASISKWVCDATDATGY